MNGRQRLEELVAQLEEEVVRLDGEVGQVERLEEILAGALLRIDRLEELVTRLLGGFCSGDSQLRGLVLEQAERLLDRVRLRHRVSQIPNPDDPEKPRNSGGQA